MLITKLPVPEPEEFERVLMESVLKLPMNPDIIMYVLQDRIGDYDIPPVYIDLHDIDEKSVNITFRWLEDIPESWKRLGYKKVG